MSPACGATVIKTANEGARIVVEAVQRPRGFQAFRILSLDESTALHPSELPLPRTHVHRDADERARDRRR